MKRERIRALGANVAIRVLSIGWLEIGRAVKDGVLGGTVRAPVSLGVGHTRNATVWVSAGVPREAW